jgi:spore germination protein GerM
LHSDFLIVQLALQTASYFCQLVVDGSISEGLVEAKRVRELTRNLHVCNGAHHKLFVLQAQQLVNCQAQSQFRTLAPKAVELLVGHHGLAEAVVLTANAELLRKQLHSLGGNRKDHLVRQLGVQTTWQLNRRQDVVYYVPQTKAITKRTLYRYYH